MNFTRFKKHVMRISCNVVQAFILRISRAYIFMSSLRLDLIINLRHAENIICTEKFFVQI